MARPFGTKSLLPAVQVNNFTSPFPRLFQSFCSGIHHEFFRPTIPSICKNILSLSIG
ncbi:hypothetical protein EMIT091MI3_80130 [Kosakonia quasisacchari]